MVTYLPGGQVIVGDYQVGVGPFRHRRQFLHLA
jgi:hypothetical protein